MSGIIITLLDNTADQNPIGDAIAEDTPRAFVAGNSSVTVRRRMAVPQPVRRRMLDCTEQETQAIRGTRSAYTE